MRSKIEHPGSGTQTPPEWWIWRSAELQGGIFLNGIIQLFGHCLLRGSQGKKNAHHPQGRSLPVTHTTTMSSDSYSETSDDDSYADDDSDQPRSAHSAAPPLARKRLPKDVWKYISEIAQ